jgi:hypothetical protein
VQGAHVEFHDCKIGKAVVWEKAATKDTPQVRYRQVSLIFARRKNHDQLTVIRAATTTSSSNTETSHST